MVLNPFFQQGSTSEQNLVQSLINEQLQIYGVNVHYMPRKYANSNTIIKGLSNLSLMMRILLKVTLNLLTGMEKIQHFYQSLVFRQLMNLHLQYQEIDLKHISPLMKNEENVRLSTRPKEGDLIYFPLVIVYLKLNMLSMSNHSIN